MIVVVHAHIPNHFLKFNCIREKLESQRPLSDFSKTVKLMMHKMEYWLCNPRRNQLILVGLNSRLHYTVCFGI